MLVVQRTGWGKSVVYFVATKLLRSRGCGPALLISPLLSLMRNQIEAARRMGLRTERITSEVKNKAEWKKIQEMLHQGGIDLLLISPERLGNQSFVQETLLPIAHQIGLLIVDEAHCISDWGHDFRPDYRRITRILQTLPRNLPLLATTATANDRVVADLKQQIGPELSISRGGMTRQSLRMQVLSMPSQEERLAWLAAAIPKLTGSGIVYCLTVRDARNVSNWLNERGIRCEGYWGSLDDDSGESGRREKLEEMLLRNEIKALVATTALGMGYDKPDLGFVIHFQSPGSVVSYYQQAGRAGRQLNKAFAILLCGEEDREINDYFVNSAFPDRNTVEQILRHLKRTPGPSSIAGLQAALNLSRTEITKGIKLLALESPAPIFAVEKGKWQATANELSPEFWRRVERLTATRQREQEQMREYATTKECLMQFLSRALDDAGSTPCGHCANCLGRTLTREIYQPADLQMARSFLRGTSCEIELKKRWPAEAFTIYDFSGNIRPELAGVTGRALCEWGDAGWGDLIKEGKYQAEKFPDELVDALASLVTRWQPQPAPKWVVPVPSLGRFQLVPDLARRLALKLNLEFRPCIRKKRETAPQKEMRNSYQQARNLDGAFELEPWDGMDGPVLLVDDVVDSAWTFTVLAALLRQAGSGPVYPVALALSHRTGEG